MAQLTAANAAAYGHQGAQGSLAFFASSRPQPISLQFAYKMVRERGYPSCYFSKRGAKHSAAAESEGAAAATPSALNTPTGTTLTPAGYLISIGINDHAVNRSLEVNDPIQIAREEIAYGCGIYLMDDATVGMGALYVTATATEGDSGAALTLDGVLDAAMNPRVNLDDANLGIAAIIDGKGAEDLNRDILTNGAAYLSNPAVSKFVQSIADTKGMVFDEDNGFWMSPDGRTAIFVEPGYLMLVQSGGNRIGCAMVPVSETLKGTGVRLSNMQTGARRISPAFAMAVDENPIAAAQLGMAPNQVERVMGPSGPIAVAADANTGVPYGVLRGRGRGTVALVNDNSASQLLYVA